MPWSVILLLLTALLVYIQAETIEVRSGKEVEFYEDLQKSAHWGVQFQIVEGTVGFRVRGEEGLLMV